MMAPNSSLNFVLGLSVGLVFAYLGLSYLSGPTSVVFETTVPREKDSFLTHEDMDKIQNILHPLEFKDAHAHNGGSLIIKG